MIVLMKCLNEEKSAKRCISDFYDEKFCEKIIVIDGGSSDYTVQEIKEIARLTIFIEQNHLPEIRAKIVSLAAEYNYSVIQVAHVVYCLLSCGISGLDTMRTLQLTPESEEQKIQAIIMELAHDADIRPNVAQEVLIILINAGLMSVERADEAAKKNLRYWRSESIHIRL